MELKPEIKEVIKGSLSLVMNEQEAEKYMDLGYAINTIKQGQVCWQAPVSVGVHAAILHLWEKTDDEGKAVLQGLIGHALEPVEALLDSLKPKPGEEYLEDEHARMLFHTCFGLGFLLLAKGDHERSKVILHDMAATQLSVWGNEYRSGPGILEATDDVRRGKWLAALLMGKVYEDEENYGGALYLLTEAYACNPGYTFLVEKAVSLLDLGAAKCVSEDATQELEFPTLNWLELFAEAAEILSLCQDTDSSGALPNECKKGSAQFLAYKFGQIAGRFAFEDERWRGKPLEKARDLCDAIWDIDEADWPRGLEKTNQALYTVAALLCEYDLRRDWTKQRDQYVKMWQTVYIYRGTSLSQIGPESDLYWAMRIGFADRMLEATTRQAVVPLETSLPDFVKAIGRTENITSYIAQLLLKQQRDDERKHQELLQLLPADKQKILASLARQLDSILHELPSDVVDQLVEAEQLYQIGTRTRPATISFAQAVEACFRCYFVNPLIDYVRKENPGYMTLVVGPGGKARPIRVGISSSRESRVWDPGHLSLQQWAGLFEMLVDPGRKGKANLQMNIFINQRWPALDVAVLGKLVQPLGEVQKYRNNAVHPPQPPRPYREEKNELEQMRNLVLGIDKASVISQIFQLLSAKK